MMNVNETESVRRWLTELRVSVEEEDVMTSTNLPTSPPSSSEELMKSISPEACRLLREILSGSCFEELELRKKKLAKKCSCEEEEEEGEEPGRRIRTEEGVLAWQNILHWAECDCDLLEEEEKGERGHGREEEVREISYTSHLKRLSFDLDF
jgi:hypothetical protein